ncbi:MAG: AAA family ATPase [Acidobacteria bacterium]|nr:AAA family ATPase [Acidobacteriota bacterium]MCI0568396.1 AAA family ATPase [Acidobacteriota bacterium]
MKTSKMPQTELYVVSDRPAFLNEVVKAVGEPEGIGVKSLEAPARPSSLNVCLSALESNPTCVLLVDAEGDSAAALLMVQELFDRKPTPRIFVTGHSGDSELMLRAQRAGAGEFLTLPLEHRHLLEALHRLWRRLTPEAPAQRNKRGRIFTFLGTKGGCGATTLATNLAVSLVGSGQSTLLVDLDLSAGDAALLLNLSPTFSVSDAVANTHRMDRELFNGMVLKHVSGLEVLAATENPDKAAVTDPTRVAQLLKFVREQYDCVVVNTGTLADPATQASLTQADLIHVVTTLDLLALRRAQWCLRRLEQAGIGSELIRLVVNRYDKNPYITRDEAETVLERKVAWTVPLDTRSIPEALNDGIPFVSRNRNGLSTCFENYAMSLAPNGGSPASPHTRKKVLGIFPKGMARISHHGASA